MIPRQRRRGIDKKQPDRIAWTDPHSLAAQVERHLGWLEARDYAETSVESRRRDITAFVLWCEERGLTRPPELTRLVLDLYQKRVARIERRDGATISPRTQRLKLLAVAGFCKWLARERLVLYNPAAELELPKVGHYLPRTVLTVEEAEQVLAVPNLETPLGLKGPCDPRDLLLDRHPPVGADAARGPGHRPRPPGPGHSPGQRTA